MRKRGAREIMEKENEKEKQNENVIIVENVHKTFNVFYDKTNNIK